ncbi:MAG TPA: D-alanine--D-alanine ligase [Mollicutes bacterium]|nr:D-alanine--D-alanine ligase [Mollicutes bacterium]
MKLRIGVIFGGQSVEHEVSIISAVQAMQEIDSDKYDVVPIYITKEKEWYTGNLLKDISNYQDLDNLKRYAKNVVLYNRKGRFVLQSKKGIKRIVDEIDVAFPIVHGLNVEDGTLAGYLDLIGIPYVGSDVYASVVGQDKVFMKQIFEAEKLPITKYEWFFDNEYIEDSKKILDKIKKLEFPVIVKPAKLGSSIGIAKVNKVEDIEIAIEEAMKYDNKIVVEEVVQDLIEVNCAVLGNYEYQQTSEIEEVISVDEFLTYKDKYLGNTKGGKSKGMVSTSRRIPANIDDALRKEVRKLARNTFRVLNSTGVCRIDFLVDSKKNKVYINEINTIPGSLSFYLFEPIGKDYTSLLDELITLGIKEYKRKNKMTHSFDSNILENYGGSKGSNGKLKFRQLK